MYIDELSILEHLEDNDTETIYGGRLLPSQVSTEVAAAPLLSVPPSLLGAPVTIGRINPPLLIRRPRPPREIVVVGAPIVVVGAPITIGRIGGP